MIAYKCNFVYHINIIYIIIITIIIIILIVIMIVAQMQAVEFATLLLLVLLLLLIIIITNRFDFKVNALLNVIQTKQETETLFFHSLRLRLRMCFGYRENIQFQI